MRQKTVNNTTMNRETKDSVFFLFLTLCDFFQNQAFLQHLEWC